MTNTTNEAPERIWLQLGAGNFGSHTWEDHKTGWGDGWDDDGSQEPEYVRADLIEELEAKLAKAIEALEFLEIAATGAGVPHPKERELLHDCIRKARNTLAELGMDYVGGYDEGAAGSCSLFCKGQDQ